MAEGTAIGNPSSATSTPVTLNVPGGYQPPQQPAQAPAQQQPQGQFNPEQLPAELKTQYESWQNERKEWETKNKAWESERSKYSDMEKQFQNLEKQVKEYANIAKTWEPWLPIINGINQPGRIEQVLALSRGETLKPTAEPTQQTAQQTLTRFLQGVGDDDVVTGAMVNQALGQLQNQLKQDVLKEAETKWTTYGQQAAQQLMQQLLGVNNEYYGMADQLLNLKLQKLYGLQPKEGALFDEQRIIQEAQRLNNRDLNLAYTLLYGDEQTKQAVMQSQQQIEAANKKSLEEAYQRGLKEGRLNEHNQQNPLLSPTGVSSLPQFKAVKQSGYGQAEASLREALNGIGVRG